MEQKREYDIFISYRRMGGESTAKMLYDSLSDMGYKVFLDVETLRSGQFNTELYEVIDGCKDVVLVLAPGSLDRCDNDDDWVRLEIAHALKQGKNIVPVMLRGFSFPEQLPEDIDPVRFCNGLTANTEFYNAFLERLREFLKSRPVLLQMVKSNASFKKTVAAVLALVVLIFAGIGGSQLWKARFPDEYPGTKAEKNAVGRLIGNLTTNLGVAEVIFQENILAYEAYEKYLQGDESYEKLTGYIDFYSSQISQAQGQIIPAPSDLLADLKDSAVSLADFEAFEPAINLFAEDSLKTFQNLNNSLGPDSPLSPADKAIFLSTSKDLTVWEADALMTGLYELLLPVSDKATETFRKESLPLLYSINKLKTVSWSSDPVQIASDKEELETRAKRLSDKLTETVGNTNMALSIEKSKLTDTDRLLQFMMDSGMPLEKAQTQLNTWLSAGLTVKEILRLYETGEWTVDPAEDEKYRSDLKDLMSRAGFTKQEVTEMMEEIDESGLPAKLFYNSLHEKLEQTAGKMDTLKEGEKKLDSSQTKLEDLRAEIRKKYAPDAGDSQEKALNKICSLIDAWLYEDAMDNCRFMLENGGSDAVLYQAVQSFTGQIWQTGIDYGFLVIENSGKMELRPGDIILAVDDEICWSFDGLTKLKDRTPESHTFTLEILRMEDGKSTPVQLTHSGKTWGITLFPLYSSYHMEVPEDPEEKEIFENTIPYSSDSEDTLIEKAMTRLQAGMNYQCRQVFQECLFRYGKQDPQLKAGLISAIRFIPSDKSLSYANGAIVCGCKEELEVRPGDIIIKAGDVFCKDLSVLYGQLKNDGTPCRLTILRMNEEGDFDELEVTGDSRIKQCRLMEFNRLK